MPSMYDKFESIQVVKPESQILDILASLGISYELFSNTSTDSARKLGDAILKAVAGELHPDRGNVYKDINGVTIQDINLLRSMLADPKVDITKEAARGKHKTHELLRQSEELDQVKVMLRCQRHIGGLLLTELVEEREISGQQMNTRNAVLLTAREENTVHYRNDGKVDYESVFIDRAIKFNDEGVVEDAVDYYEDETSRKLLLVKKIDELAASDIIGEFSGVEPENLKSMRFMIIDGLLYSALPMESFRPTGISFLAQKKAEEKLLKSISGLPLRLTFAKPKNAGDSEDKVVAPVFKYNEGEDVPGGSKLIGSKFVGYYFFPRIFDSLGSVEDSITKKALEKVDHLERSHSIIVLNSTEMINLQSRSSSFTANITNNDVDNLRHSGYTVTVFSKKNKNTGKVEYYVVPEVYKVASPHSA